MSDGEDFDPKRAATDLVYFAEHVSKANGWPALRPWQRKLLERMQHDRNTRREWPINKPARFAVEVARATLAVERITRIQAEAEGCLFTEMQCLLMRDAIAGLDRAGMPREWLAATDIEARLKASEVWHWAEGKGWRARAARAMAERFTGLKPPTAQEPRGAASGPDGAK